jgi:hypothetical protein
VVVDAANSELSNPIGVSNFRSTGQAPAANQAVARNDDAVMLNLEHVVQTERGYSVLDQLDLTVTHPTRMPGSLRQRSTSIVAACQRPL